MSSRDGCAVLIALEFLRGFAEDKMCGKCLPCMLGVAQMTDILEAITKAEGEEGDIRMLEAVSSAVVDTARCKLGKDAAGFILESLATSLEEYEEHISERHCAKKSCEALTSYSIIPERCTLCGACKEICPVDAVVGEKLIPHLSDNRPYYIRGKRCNRCGECLAVCEDGAIEIV